MERVLNNIEPTNVFKYFEDISLIPRMSGKEQAVAEYCVDFARLHSLEYSIDNNYNVVIRKPASKGMEEHPVVMLQGHLDMVCEKNMDIQHNFDIEPLYLYIDGDFIRAKGTTLGGDNGVAVAYMLAILADDSLIHPELEAIFTTEEEVGLDGAHALDVTSLKAKYMINMDSEDEGEFVAGCAGGRRTHIAMPLSYKAVKGNRYQIVIKGLMGGHSGMEIDKCRANANILMGRLLYKFNSDILFDIISISGGLKDNAIPREAIIDITTENYDKLSASVAEMLLIFHNEYSISDKDINIEILSLGEYIGNVFEDSVKNNIINCFLLSFNGIQSMCAGVSGLPESSSNLGVIYHNEEEIEFVFALRSSVKSLKLEMYNKLEAIAKVLDCRIYYVGDYPEWEYNPNSRLREICVNEYKKLYKKEPIVRVLHCGLESGIFYQKISNLDVVSLGPDLFDVHTPDEHLSISSTARVYELLKAVLAAI